MPRTIPRFSIPAAEIEMTAIPAQGAGGQNVNKVATAIHLRFDIRASSLPEEIKERLLACSDRRITADGTVVIKAQRHRTQEKNRGEAVARLLQLVASISTPPRARRPTKPTGSSKTRRLDAKTRRGSVKALRNKVQE